VWIPDFLLKLLGKTVANKLELKEGPMDSSKAWYTSKGVWTGIVTFLIGAYSLVSITIMPALGHAALPSIPDWLLTILGAIGVYSRVSADKTIG
jgi:hypothetical protein